MTRPAEKSALQLSAREYPDGPFAQCRDAHEVEHVVYFAFQYRLGALGALAHETRGYDLFYGNGKFAVDTVFLGQVSDVERVDRLTLFEKIDGSPRRLLQAQYGAQQRGLSPAVRPRNQQKVALVDIQVYVFEYTLVGV